jgi:hypothetical protein
MITVIFNTLAMMMNGLSFTTIIEKELDIANTIFTFIFIFEMSIKILALNPVGYVRDKINLFDGSIVILSLVDLSLQGESNL